MLIKGKSCGDAQALHYHFARTVCERPTLIAELDKNAPGTGKIIGSNFYYLAYFLFDSNFPRSHGYGVTLSDFKKGKEFIENVIGSN